MKRVSIDKGESSSQGRVPETFFSENKFDGEMQRVALPQGNGVMQRIVNYINQVSQPLSLKLSQISITSPRSVSFKAPRSLFRRLVTFIGHAGTEIDLENWFSWMLCFAHSEILTRTNSPADKQFASNKLQTYDECPDLVRSCHHRQAIHLGAGGG